MFASVLLLLYCPRKGQRFSSVTTKLNQLMIWLIWRQHVTFFLQSLKHRLNFIIETSHDIGLHDYVYFRKIWGYIRICLSIHTSKSILSKS